jgi:ABC-type uncharacterized transport system permease subunit
VPDIVIHAVAAAAYAGLAWHFWNTRWRTRPAAPAAGGLRPWERAAILMPLALHGGLLYAELFAAPELRFGFAYALSSMFWLVFFYWVEPVLQHRQRAAAGSRWRLAVPLPALFPGAQARVPSLNSSCTWCWGCSPTACSVAILHALLMALVGAAAPAQRRGAGSAPLMMARQCCRARWALPPLLTQERLLFRLITAAFVLLTCTLATGLAFSETLFGQPLRFDHKTLFAVLSWATFAALLAGRHFYGWRGRTALRWTLSGFVLLLLAYIGSRFALEVVLGRT